VEGGIPLIVDGKIVGAIGVSGATSVQDAQMRQGGRGHREVSSADDRAWPEKTVYLSLGSNVGDREANLRAAIAALGDASVSCDAGVIV